MFDSQNKLHERIVMRAPQGQYFTPDSFDGIKEAVSLAIHEQWPKGSFEFVQTGPNSFNLVQSLGHA